MNIDELIKYLEQKNGELDYKFYNNYNSKRELLDVIDDISSTLFGFSNKAYNNSPEYFEYTKKAIDDFEKDTDILRGMGSNESKKALTSRFNETKSEFRIDFHELMVSLKAVKERLSGEDKL